MPLAWRSSFTPSMCMALCCFLVVGWYDLRMDLRERVLPRRFPSTCFCSSGLSCMQTIQHVTNPQRVYIQECWIDCSSQAIGLEIPAPVCIRGRPVLLAVQDTQQWSSEMVGLQGRLTILGSCCESMLLAQLTVLTRGMSPMLLQRTSTKTYCAA